MVGISDASFTQQHLSFGAQKPIRDKSRMFGAAVYSVQYATIARKYKHNNAVSRTADKPFPTKKRLNLQLNVGVCADDAQSIFWKIGAAGQKQYCEPPTNQTQILPVEGDSHWVGDGAAPAKILRRQPTLTIGMNSPQGALFGGETQNDGPADLGKDTKRIAILGKGAGGTVYFSLYLPCLKFVAVKEVVVHNENDRRLVVRELHALHENLAPMVASSVHEVCTTKFDISAMWHRFTRNSSSSSSPYITSFYGAFLVPSRSAVSIVMEYMDLGSLQNVLDHPNQFPISEAFVRHVAYSCMHALSHMHSKRMMHRDIKLANILLNRNGEFKVADFGLTTTLSKSSSFCSEFQGTLMYMAPERITGKLYGLPSDIWSLGIVLFCLAAGKYPFDTHEGFFGIEEAIVHNTLPPLPNTYSPDCRQFIKSLLRRDPMDRPTASQALKHPFLAAYGSKCRQWTNFINVWQTHTSAAVDLQDTYQQKIATFVTEYNEK